MGRQELIERIRVDGGARVVEIEADRDRRLAQIRARFERASAELEQEFGGRTAQATKMIRERQASRARLERRKALLAARWRVLDRAFELAGERLVTGKEYAKIVKGLVAKHAPPGSKVRAAERDRKLVAGKRGVKPGEPAQIGGGILIETGRRVLDLSVDEALSAVREDLASELAGMLFPEAAGPEH